MILSNEGVLGRFVNVRRFFNIYMYIRLRERERENKKMERKKERDGERERETEQGGARIQISGLIQ